MPWEMSQGGLDTLDKNVMLLAGCAKAGVDFVRKGLRPMKWTGSAKCADFAKLCEEGPGDFMYKESLPASIAPAVKNLLKLLQLLKSVTCDVNDPLAEAGLAATKAQVTLMVCEYERFFPRTEVCRVSHIMLHVCDIVHRWNNVRNYWCFLTERYVAHSFSTTTVITVI